jgi:hypothetical protein
MTRHYSIETDHTPTRRAFTIYGNGEPLWKDEEHPNDLTFHVRLHKARQLVIAANLGSIMSEKAKGQEVTE